MCFSLTGNLPFVRSGRQGCMCAYVCFSLTGDLPFVRSGRQGRMCFINYNRHFKYTVQKHRGSRSSEAKQKRRKIFSIEVTMRDGKLRET